MNSNEVTYKMTTKNKETFSLFTIKNFISFYSFILRLRYIEFVERKTGINGVGIKILLKLFDRVR